ncbi:MAG: ATP-grasp domain-containing protein [Chloroflexi bacterium]|nr:ATP-grasp domain-containing protein [Chloroflexota bacterium]
MRTRVAIVYNEPIPSRYNAAGEEKAVLGVLEAVTAVRRSLLKLGYQVTPIPLTLPDDADVGKLRSLKVDLVFNLFEGFAGYPESEALVPEDLAEQGIPYTGCSAIAIRRALDKAEVKVILKAAGIPTPDFQLLNPQTLPMFRLSYPCIVKPASEDASHGISEASVVDTAAMLAKQVELVSSSYGGDALVEEFIDGREFNATVLGNSQPTVLPVSEIVYLLPPGMPRILTFAAKWQPDSLYFQGTKVVCPAEMSTGEGEHIAATALAAFRLLGCRGYARVDMRRDKEGRLNVIEMNPNPDISPGSGAVRQAAAAGMTYTQFIEKIVQLALDKEPHDHQHPTRVEKRQTSLDEDIAQYSRV